MEILSKKENGIFLKNKMTPQELITLKQRDIQSLTKQLELISPKKHRFFKKQYALEADYGQTNLLISDIQEYSNLLSNQARKIHLFLKDYSVDQFLQNLFKHFSAFSLEFCNKMGNLLAKISKKCENSEVSQQTQPSQQCGGCKQNILDYRFSKLKQQLNLSHFEDKFHFFNIDNINYSELDALKRESNNIIQSELAENENIFLFKGNCISLEQYQQVLNLLGSDLHQKNAHIQKIIQYLIQTDKKLINQDHFKHRQSEEEMKIMERMVQEETIKGKLKEMIVQSLRRYVRNKLQKMVDGQVQVNIKENEIIRELQRQKKGLKSKYTALFKQKQRLISEYDGKIKKCQLELESTRELFKKQISKLTQQGVATAKKYTEACHLNEVYRLQIDNLTSQYTQLMTTFSKQSASNLQREKNSRQSQNSNSTRQQGSKKIKSRARIKKSIQRDANGPESVSEIQIEDKDLDSSSIIKEKDRKQSRKNSINRKTSLALNRNPSQTIISSLKDAYKYGTYQQIDEKQEQEELDDKLLNHSKISHKNKDDKPKISRFKAIMTHFNSNLLAQHLNEDQSLEKDDLLKSSMQYKMQKEGKVVQQANAASKDQQKVSIENEKNSNNKPLIQNLLQRLFESEKHNGRVQIQLNIFLQKYNQFICQLSSQKGIARSSSLKIHDITQRKNRISTKYDYKISNYTSKSIEEGVNNDNCSQKLRNEKSSNSSKRLTLQKIQRKSQKQLKKITKTKDQFYFGKTGAKTADNTHRSSLLNKNLVKMIPPSVNTSLSHSRVDLSPPLLTNQEIMNLFLNIKNIDNFSQEVDRHQADSLAPMESQILMKIYAQMAHLHLKDVAHYEQLKKIIFYPKQMLENKQIISNKQSINHLKSSLQYITKIHRICPKPKGSQECRHLSSFLQKLISLSQTTSN